MLLGQADHDTIFVVSSEDALGFLAVEGPAHLVGESLLRNSQFGRARLEAQFDFILRSALVSPGLGDAVVGTEEVRNLFRDGLLGLRGGSA